MRFRLLIILAGLICSQNVWAQVTEDLEIIEQALEELEGDFDFEELAEQLLYLRDHPINLNKTNFEDLSTVPFLSPNQVTGILLYRERFGKFLSIFELQAVPILDIYTIRNILPYVAVKAQLDDVQLSVKDLLTQGDHQVYIRAQRILEKQKGYDDTQGAPNYFGDPNKLYLRYRYQFPKKLSFGITAEKDNGEALFKSPNKNGFDFYSAHLFLKNTGQFKAIALGDYSVSMGQGLIYYTGFGFGKSSEVTSIKKGQSVLKPYTSTAESNFNRGAGVTWATGKWEATIFGSSTAIDGNVQTTDSGQDAIETVSSLLNSGYHRTESELVDRKALRLNNGGLNLQYGDRKYHIGINAVYNGLSTTLQKNIQPYNQFEFSGDELLAASMDYHYVWKNMHFFGEWAASDNGGKALLNGLLVSLDRKVDLAFAHRHYEKDYQSLAASAFGESSSPANESGFYAGLSIRPNRRWRFNAYADHFRFPWLRFGIDAPSVGHEHLAQIDFAPSRSTKFYLRYKLEQKSRNIQVAGQIIDGVADRVKKQYRLNFSKKVNNIFTLNARIEWSSFAYTDDSISNGVLIYQELVVSPLGSKFSGNARIALFETDDYNSRIYAFEKDVLYAFSIPAFSGTGMRYYLNLRYKFNRAVSLWVRLSQTNYRYTETISSGNEEIIGNTKTEVKTMLRLRF